QRWRLDQRAHGTEIADERWQRALWRAAVAALDRGQPGHVTLGEALGADSLRTANLPSRLTLFGFSHVAQVYHDFIQRLGALPNVDLRLYALNPCAEFWEDLVTHDEQNRQDRPRREDARQGVSALRPQGEEDLDPERDFYDLEHQGPEALRLWGRPGRENIRLLNELSDFEFTPAFAPAPQTTLLATLQNDILHYRDAGPAELEADGSIRFLAAPSPRREAEIVATEIWRLVEASARTERPMRFSDIAVIVPPGDQATYLAHLQAAFQETHPIPWVHGDGLPTVMNRMLEAASLLVDLPASGLTRAAVLRVLAHPSVQKALGETNVPQWTRWCDRLGIVRGLDREAWADTYLDRDALNWDQGAKRLALGAFLMEDQPWEWEGQRYGSLEEPDLESAGTFLAIVRALTTEAEALGRASHDPSGWAEQMGAYLRRWLECEDEASMKALERLVDALRPQEDAVPDLPRLDFKGAHFLFREALEGLQSPPRAGLTRGVVVSSYTPMRAIPFRAIFLMGLGEGVFPTREARNALDLRTRNRHAGDVSHREMERYLFLETLLSARDHLILSHVALDELSGESLEPSGLFKEFRQLVGRYLTSAWSLQGPKDPLLEAHPLRRFDPRYFPAWFPEETRGETTLLTYSTLAQKEARARWLKKDFLAHGASPGECPATLRDLPLPEDSRRRLAHGFDTLAPDQAWQPEARLQVSLDDLRRWLESPALGAAKVRAGLRSETVDHRATVEDEPFTMDGLEAWNLRQIVTLEALRTDHALESLYEARIRELQTKGSAPFGLFEGRERTGNLQLIEAWIAYLRPFPCPETWSLGPSRHGLSPVDHALPSLMLQVPQGERTLQIEMTGLLKPQCEGSLFLEKGKPPSDSERSSLLKKVVGAYLDHLVLTLRKPDHGEHRARFVFSEAKARGGGQECEFRFSAMTAAQAEAVLVGWLQDLLSGDHAVLLPFEAIADLQEEITPEALLSWMEENPRIARIFWNALPGARKLPPPSDPRTLVSQRFGAFFEQLLPSDEGAS
ncbi:MAG: exodeoxyribonuclease V subunit gamma, partial [Firmicutes bacterium]|nr:exodeoxyribonuclease V subunit gamma [Bacillota bacterium]